MSLVWLELDELIKGRSGVALTQFSSSISGGGNQVPRGADCSCSLPLNMVPSVIMHPKAVCTEHVDVGHCPPALPPAGEMPFNAVLCFRLYYKHYCCW